MLAYDIYLPRTPTIFCTLWQVAYHATSLTGIGRPSSPVCRDATRKSGLLPPPQAFWLGGPVGGSAHLLMDR
jgi:hypothetical protein